MIVIIGVKVGTALWGSQQYHVCSYRSAAMSQLTHMDPLCYAEAENSSAAHGRACSYYLYSLHIRPTGLTQQGGLHFLLQIL